MNNIKITQHVERKISKVIEQWGADNVYLLTDSNCYNKVFSRFNTCGFYKDHVYVLPAGEQNKNLNSLSNIWDFLQQRGANRGALLLNIGGGVITDMGGFAASCFKRGIQFINVPTSLLAQVDASIGGKTGINFGHLKNEIGLFSFPVKVYVDASLLTTLPYEELISGYGEMLKHALLSSTEHIDHLLNGGLEQLKEGKAAELIRASIEVKAAIVEQDSTEQGVRRVLNLGHTIGHALESYALDHGYHVAHGVAVAWGILAELKLSQLVYGFPNGWYVRLRNHIEEFFPSMPFKYDEQALLHFMSHDKKNDIRGINFTLLEEPGLFYIDNFCSKEQIIEALKEVVYA